MLLAIEKKWQETGGSELIESATVSLLESSSVQELIATDPILAIKLMEAMHTRLYASIQKRIERLDEMRWHLDEIASIRGKFQR